MQKYIIKVHGLGEIEESDRKTALSRANNLVGGQGESVTVIQQTLMEVEIPLTAETPPAMPTN